MLMANRVEEHQRLPQRRAPAGRMRPSASKQAERIRSKYPERVPVICEKDARSDIPDIDKKKYLVPADLTVSQFTWVIRKRIKLPPESAMFLFINDHLPQASHR